MVASQHFPNLSHKKLNNENQGLMQKIFFLHVFILLLFFSGMLSAQDSTKKKLPVKITGVIGITYEGYGLSVNPKTPSFYPPRRPSNQQTRMRLATTHPADWCATPANCARARSRAGSRPRG